MEMTEAKYFKDYNHNYLILKSVETGLGEDYRYRMLASNKIGKILRCSVRNINGAVYFYYDISSKVTLENYYQGKKMSYEQVKDFFLQMDGIYQSLGEFFMEEEGLLLEPGFIYYDFTTKKYFGIYYPGKKDKTENRYEKLCDFLLNHIDNGSQRLVDIVYQVYDMSACRGFSLMDALSLFEDTEGDSGKNHANITEPMYIAGNGYDSNCVMENNSQNSCSFNSQNIVDEDIISCGMDDEQDGVYTVSGEAEYGEWDTNGNKKSISVEKKKEKPGFSSKSVTIFYSVFAVISLLGTGVMFFLYLRYELTEQEFMMVVCCAAVLGLCFVFSLVQILLSGRKDRKRQEEEKLLLEDIEDEFRDERGILIGNVLDKNMDMAVARSHISEHAVEYGTRNQNENRSNEAKIYKGEKEERYGQTVFLEAGKQEAEYKLYALDKKNKKHIRLTQFPFTIGKMPGCVDCVIADDSISRLHARIEKQDGKILLTDMNSMNGTYKNGLRMEPSETVEIEPGDEIRFGKLNYCYR